MDIASEFTSGYTQALGALLAATNYFSWFLNIIEK